MAYKLCGICMEFVSASKLFSSPKCRNHTYCNDCMATYITSKIKENKSSIRCPNPNCENKIEPENCSTILPKEVFERWGEAICEASIPESKKFYCPYKECSALMVNDTAEVVGKVECSSCRKLFCARCRVPWHVGFTCEEFKTFDEDDLELIKLAKDKEWKRCPNCNFFVERIDGCLHITCRCNYEFCYRCGSKYDSTHTC